MRAISAIILLLAAAPLFADQSVTVGPGLSFTPPKVVVAPGETVTWTWAGALHSSTSDTTSGPEVWDSGIVLDVGATFSHTFTTPGTYPYYCKIHSVPGGTAMNGSVQVVAPTTPTPTPVAGSPTPTPSATPTPTPTSLPGSTPSATATAGIPAPAAAIPVLGFPGTAALFVFLAAAGLLVLSLAHRR